VQVRLRTPCRQHDLGFTALSMWLWSLVVVLASRPGIAQAETHCGRLTRVDLYRQPATTPPENASLPQHMVFHYTIDSQHKVFEVDLPNDEALRQPVLESIVVRGATSYQSSIVSTSSKDRQYLRVECQSDGEKSIEVAFGFSMPAKNWQVEYRMTVQPPPHPANVGVVPWFTIHNPTASDWNDIDLAVFDLKEPAQGPSAPVFHLAKVGITAGATSVLRIGRTKPDDDSLNVSVQRGWLFEPPADPTSDGSTITGFPENTVRFTSTGEHLAKVFPASGTIAVIEDDQRFPVATGKDFPPQPATHYGFGQERSIEVTRTIKAAKTSELCRLVDGHLTFNQTRNVKYRIKTGSSADVEIAHGSTSGWKVACHCDSSYKLSRESSRQLTIAEVRKGQTVDLRLSDVSASAIKARLAAIRQFAKCQNEATESCSIRCHLRRMGDTFGVLKDTSRKLEEERLKTSATIREIVIEQQLLRAGGRVPEIQEKLKQQDQSIRESRLAIERQACQLRLDISRFNDAVGRGYVGCCE